MGLSLFPPPGVPASLRGLRSLRTLTGVSFTLGRAGPTDGCRAHAALLATARHARAERPPAAGRRLETLPGPRLHERHVAGVRAPGVRLQDVDAERLRRGHGGASAAGGRTTFRGRADGRRPARGAEYQGGGAQAAVPNRGVFRAVAAV